MLCLTRGEGEQIRIGESVIVTINRVRGNKVQVGIDAPSSVEIVRRELDLDGTEPTELCEDEEGPSPC
jgi:carbon storage regulator